MKKKTSLMKRIMSVMMAAVMSLAMMSVTAFAAEETTSETEQPVVRSSGTILNSGSADFVNSVTIPVYLSKGNWSADFLVNVSGNSGGYYQVDLTTPGGTTITDYVYSNSSSFTNISTFVYASAGTYYFKFTRLSGNAVTAHATAKICD